MGDFGKLIGFLLPLLISAAPAKRRRPHGHLERGLALGCTPDGRR